MHMSRKRSGLWPPDYWACAVDGSGRTPKGQ